MKEGVRLSTARSFKDISRDIIRGYSLPLVLGVIVALVFANAAPHLYEHIAEAPILFGQYSFAWLMENVFMVFFFGTAGVEIVHALSPGGSLNPLKKAVTPLMGTLGGILGPALMFLLLNKVFGQPAWSNGWGMCTATDIALAWLFAKLVFGKDHPAIGFLLLLAVADDAIGLVIIAIFYPTPGKPIQPLFLLLVVAGMLVAFALKKAKVHTLLPYIFGAGILCWIGLFKTGVSPALALVFVVPFLPKDNGTEEKGSTLHSFEHIVTPIVDYGLFFFGFANAGVRMSSMSGLTFIVMAALIVGKLLGISFFTYLFGNGFRFGLPKGMSNFDVLIASAIAGIGLTVALFIAQSAYTDPVIQGAAKMGALFSVAAGISVLLIKLAASPFLKRADRDAYLIEEALERIEEAEKKKKA